MPSATCPLAPLSDLLPLAVALFFLTGALCLSAGRGTWDLLVYHVTIAAPYPGGIDTRLAVYARSWDGHYTTTRRDRLPLAVALWGSFARPFVVCPSWTPFFVWAVLSLPSVWFLVCSLVPPLLWLLCVVPFCLCFGLLFCGCLLCGLCVPPLVLLGFRFCCAVAWLPFPAGCCLPPPFGCSLAASWSRYCAGPSLWVSGCFMRQPGCLALMLGVLWCFASSLHLASWQQRPLALCGVCVTLYTMVQLLLWCSVLLRWGIHLRMIQDPHWTAKLHTRHSLLQVWHTLLLSFSAFPAPSLPPFCLVVCGWLFVLAISCPLCNFLYLHLGERSLELSSLRGCSLVCLLSCLMLKHLARKELCLLRWLRPGETRRPQRLPFLFSFSSFVSLLLVWWWVLRPEFVFVFFVIFLGGSDVRWLCLVGIVLSWEGL